MHHMPNSLWDSYFELLLAVICSASPKHKALQSSLGKWPLYWQWGQREPTK